MRHFLICILLFFPTAAIAQHPLIKLDPEIERLVTNFENCYEISYHTEALETCEFAKPCMDIGSKTTTTYGMVACYQEATELWDKKLNLEYNILMGRAKEKDQRIMKVFQFEGFERANSLLKAQRAWIAFRDADCEDTYWANHPGSIKQLRTAKCKLDHTKSRTIKLRSENQYHNRP